MSAPPSHSHYTTTLVELDSYGSDTLFAWQDLQAGVIYEIRGAIRYSCTMQAQCIRLDFEDQPAAGLNVHVETQTGAMPDRDTWSRAYGQQDGLQPSSVALADTVYLAEISGTIIPAIDLTDFILHANRVTPHGQVRVHPGSYLELRPIS